MGIFFSSVPDMAFFDLKGYCMPFGLHRLRPGVDNNRYDVYLSEAFRAGSVQFIEHLMTETAMADQDKKFKERGVEPPDEDSFKSSYHQLMKGAVNTAKALHEPQVDYLARTAVVVFLRREINNGFDIFISNFRRLIQEKEMTRGGYRQEGSFLLKAALSDILLNRKKIVRDVGKIVFQHINDVDREKLTDIRALNFGENAQLPGDLFLNPFLYSGRIDDYFMIESYDILPGQRMEDADRYERLLSTIKKMFMEIISKSEVDFTEKTGATPSGEAVNADAPVEFTPAEYEKQQASMVDALIKQEKNATDLFDYIATREEWLYLKGQSESSDVLADLKNRVKSQRRMVRFFYKKLHASGVMKRICASFEVRSVFSVYCPPLVPQLVLQFMMVPASRKMIIQRLKRLGKLNQAAFPMRPLKKCRRRIKRLGKKQKEAFLIRFMKGFFRYHRDYENHKMLAGAMERIHLVTDENHIRLSRVNNTLYEFLLPHEVRTEEKPVISHTILKADVRGSTDIVHQMKEKGLNPASYFSLNMFEPIKTVIAEYGAFKVFIEGDAMILGIYERAERPGGWYGVARACGLAVQILQVMERYNRKNREYQLPLLEIGIGITFSEEAPTLFFDGDFEIMISPAIHLADRLSGCSKWVRKWLDGRNAPFRNYVFQGDSDKDIAGTADDIFIRYNVNGIELHPQAFRKLSREISLRPVSCVIPELQPETIKFYKGTFPTVNGQYHPLIIREDVVVKVRRKDLNPIAVTDRKYYAVCVDPRIYDHFKKYEL